MKLFIVLAAVTLAQAAKLDRVYLPPNAQASSGSDNFLQTPHQSNNGFQTQNNNDNSVSPALNGNAYAQNTNDYSGVPNANYAQNAYSGFEARPERAQAAFERNAAILRQDNSNDGETYSYAYETENGIYAEESGVATNGVQAQGGYTYTGDDGKVYSVRYTADENGFVPQGDHLPTPPPIPEEILKALEQNARDEAAGIYDDGSYSDAKYAPAGDNQQQYYNTNAQPINYNEDSVATNPAAVRNNAGFIGAVRNNQQQYYNTNAQPINYNEDSVAINPAAVRDNAGFNGAIRNNQQQYYNNNAQPNNFVDDSIATNAAVLRNGAAEASNSVDKTYLPPFAQSNNQRNGNFNARNGYRY